MSDKRNTTKCDLVILFTGKHLTYAKGASLLFTGHATDAFGVIQMVREPYLSGRNWYDVNDDQRASFAAHELGHFFGACHEGCEKIDTTLCPLANYTWARPISYWGGIMGASAGNTVMTAMPTTNVQKQFSTSTSGYDRHGDTDHDNARVMRMTKDPVSKYR